MLAAPIPDNEADRLDALHQLLIMDTPPEERFDKVEAFAAAEFDMPIVLISLIDADRQWFKSALGVNLCETSRDISFCGHAIAQPAVFTIPDALDDARFADNPLVTGYPHLRFYAGAPLVIESGHAIGTLCLIDTRPRRLDAVETAILETLRDLVVQELNAPAEALHA